jgi:hypothetical protein
MDGDLIDAGYMAVELLTKELPGFGITEKISRK